MKNIFSTILFLTSGYLCIRQEYYTEAPCFSGERGNIQQDCSSRNTGKVEFFGKEYLDAIYTYIKDLLKSNYDCKDDKHVEEVDNEIVEYFKKASFFDLSSKNCEYLELFKKQDYEGCYNILKDICDPCEKTRFDNIVYSKKNTDIVCVGEAYNNLHVSGSSIAIVGRENITFIPWNCCIGNDRMFKNTLYIPSWILDPKKMAQSSQDRDAILFNYLYNFMMAENDVIIDKSKKNDLFSLFKQANECLDISGIIYTKLAICTLLSCILQGVDMKETLCCVRSILEEWNQTIVFNLPSKLSHSAVFLFGPEIFKN